MEHSQGHHPPHSRPNLTIRTEVVPLKMEGGPGVILPDPTHTVAHPTHPSHSPSTPNTAGVPVTTPASAGPGQFQQCPSTAGTASAEQPKRKKGSRSVSTLTPAQLSRKRANDREAQRAIRARTKENTERLEREVAFERKTKLDAIQVARNIVSFSATVFQDHGIKIEMSQFHAQIDALLNAQPPPPPSQQHQQPPHQHQQSHHHPPHVPHAAYLSNPAGLDRAHQSMFMSGPPTPAAMRQSEYDLGVFSPNPSPTAPGYVGVTTMPAEPWPMMGHQMQATLSGSTTFDPNSAGPDPSFAEHVGYFISNDSA